MRVFFPARYLAHAAFRISQRDVCVSVCGYAHALSRCSDFFFSPQKSRLFTQSSLMPPTRRTGAARLTCSMYGALCCGASQKETLDRVTKTLLGREWCDGESPPETPAEHNLFARRNEIFLLSRAPCTKIS